MSGVDGVFFFVIMELFAVGMMVVDKVVLSALEKLAVQLT